MMQSFSPILSSVSKNRNNKSPTQQWETADGNVQTGSPDSPTTAPVLNGKRVLPFKVMMAGLKGHKVPGVYVILNSNYKRGYVLQHQ